MFYTWAGPMPALVDKEKATLAFFPFFYLGQAVVKVIGIEKMARNYFSAGLVNKAGPATGKSWFFILYPVPTSTNIDPRQLPSRHTHAKPSLKSQAES